ncbi:AAA family ATPase [Streptomyces sp. NPDC049040]|uniref:nSTAND1 domain-containing NTPase n=1 Tax=Streptomyces sp. NPDC049040 TaxID=3365593 RepID=UPI0037153945
MKLVLDVLLMLVGALLGIATNYATGDTGSTPWLLRELRTWSVPLVAAALLLLVAGQVWLYVLDRPTSPRRLWRGAQPPYPGLESFNEDDAAVFFGRDSETAELVGRLHPAVPARAHRFVTVVGPSGSGKSSLVRAGLLPALARRRRRWAVVPPYAPGADPLTAFAASLATVLPGATTAQVRAELAGGPAGVRRYLDLLRRSVGGDAAPVLVVVDQLEELFVLTGDDERDAFLSLLSDCLHADSRLWVVATLRSDFLTAFLGTGFAGLLRHPMAVGVLSRAELLQTIERPAEMAGLAFAPGLVARMVEDTGGGDALPLLAYTLQELFLRVGPGGTVTEDAYRQLGGVAGALSDRADRITGELRAADPDAPVFSALLKFVGVEHGEATRRRVRRADITPEEQLVADAFVAGRLLVSHADLLDVAHEALFRQWPLLRQAVAVRAEQLQHRTELERWALDWRNSGFRDSYLLTGERLEAAQRWAAEATGVFEGIPVVTALLERSRRQDRAALERLSEAVARRAMEAAAGDPQLALLASLAAVECAPTSTALQALHIALNVSRLGAVFRGHEGDINAVAWSPEGTRLASASDDGTVRIWTLHENPDGATVLARRGGAPVGTVAWSPDGRRLAAGARDGGVTVWDTAGWTVLALLSDTAEAVAAVAWSPDGHRLAAGGGDRTVRIWDSDTYAPVTVLSEHRRRVSGVAWSPDGHRLASSSVDGAVHVWTVTPPTGGGPAAVHSRHHDSVWGLAWSRHGDKLATASEDHAVLVLDMVDGSGTAGEVIMKMETPGAPTCVAWSPDDQSIATGDDDRTARVWHLETNEQTLLIGHSDSIHGIAWHGSRVATASRDRTVAVWDTVPCGSHSRALLGHTDSVWDVAWSPDGGRLATASQDGRALIWDGELGPAVTELPHEGGALGVAWSPDGRRLVTSARGGTARIWDVRDRLTLVELRGHSDELTAVSWAPDGTRIATTSRDGTARIWDAGDGTELLVLGRRAGWVGGAAWSPDSRCLATSATSRTLTVWDTLRGAELTTLRGHTDYAWRIAWSPDGRRLATGSRDRTVRTWDPLTGEALITMTGHQDRVQGVAWSPDGRSMATVSWDRTIRLWDPVSGRERTVIGVHDDQINGLSWHPDGSRLATASRDRSIRIWEPSTDPEPLLRRARARAFRQLTVEERRSLLLPPVEPQESQARPTL